MVGIPGLSGVCPQARSAQIQPRPENPPKYIEEWVWSEHPWQGCPRRGRPRCGGPTLTPQLARLPARLRFLSTGYRMVPPAL